jgi:hypothetical protein
MMNTLNSAMLKALFGLHVDKNILIPILRRDLMTSIYPYLYTHPPRTLEILT